MLSWLMNSLEELINEDLIVRHVLENTEYMTLQIMVVDDDLHTLTTKYVGGPDQNRVADFFGNAHCVIHIVGDTIFRIRNAQVFKAV